MHYLNQHLGPWKHLSPDIYDALTIGDFVRSKDQIHKPSKWKMVNPVMYTKIKDYVIIGFRNVNLNVNRFANGYVTFTMFDLSDSLFIIPDAMPWDTKKFAQFASLKDGRYNQVNVLYSPFSDLPLLMSAERFEPIIPEDSYPPNLEKILDISLAEVQ